MDPVGLGAALAFLRAWVPALLICAALCVLGRAWRRLWRIDGDEAWIDGLCGLHALVLLAFVWVGLGLAAWAPGILAVCVLAAAVQRREPWPRFACAHPLLAGIGVVAAIPAALRAALPNSDWDTAAYHLPLALRFLGAVPFASDFYYPNANYPAGASLLATLPLAWGGDTVPAALSLLACWLGVVIAGAAGRAWGGRTAGRFAALGMASSPMFWETGIDWRTDNWLATSLAVGVWATGARRVDARSRALVTAMAIGLAIGFKYSALWPALVLLASLGLEKLPSRKTLLAIAALVLLPNGFWYLRNAIELGDPLHAELRGRRIEGVDGVRRPLASLLDSHRGDPALRARLDPPDPDRLRPRNALHPAPWLGGHARWDDKPWHAPGPAWWALPALVPWWREPRVRRFLLLAAAIGGPLALVAFRIRYMLPALPWAAVAVGLLAERLASSRLRSLVAALCAAAFLAHAGGCLQALSDEAVAAWWRGELDRAGWERARGYNGVLAFVRARDRIEFDGRVLMLWEGKGWSDPRWIPDPSSVGHRWLGLWSEAGFDDDRLHRRLWDEGVRGVLVNDGYRDWLARTDRFDRDLAALSWTTLERFLGARAVPLPGVAKVRLFRLCEPVERAGSTHGCDATADRHRPGAPAPPGVPAPPS